MILDILGNWEEEASLDANVKCGCGCGCGDGSSSYNAGLKAGTSDSVSEKF